MKSNKQFRTEILNEATNWIANKYPNSAAIKSLEYNDIQWSNTCRFAKFRLKPDKKGRQIRIQLTRRSWITYKRKTIGILADGIKCSEQQSLMLQLIHELTHFVQSLENRKFSEVETTRNEIEYAKENYPYLYNQLIPIKD